MGNLQGEQLIEVRAGSGEPPSMRTTPGRDMGPISIGTGGAWRIDAQGVLDKHAYLFFDGQRLFAQSVDLNAPALVDGRPIPLEWTPLVAPCELALGAARIFVRTSEDAEVVEDADVVEITGDSASMNASSPNDVPTAAIQGLSEKPKTERPFAPGAFSRRDEESSAVTRFAPIEELAAKRTGTRPLTPGGFGIPAAQGSAPRQGEYPSGAYPQGGQGMAPLTGSGAYPQAQAQAQGGGQGGFALGGGMSPTGGAAGFGSGAYPQAGFGSMSPHGGAPGSGAYPQAQMPGGGAYPQGGAGNFGGGANPQLNVSMRAPDGGAAQAPTWHNGVGQGAASGLAPQPKGWWGQLSFPRKATLIMLLPMAASVVVIFFDHPLWTKAPPALPTASARTASSAKAPTTAVASATAATTASSAVASGAPAAGSAPTAPASPAAPTTAVAPRGVPAGPTPPADAPEKAGSRTLQREAADAVASGAYERATKLYDQLAKRHPDVPAYAEAASITRARAAAARK